MKVQNVVKVARAHSPIPSIMPAHATEGEISGSNFLDALPIGRSAARLPCPTRNAPCAAVFIDRDTVHASRRRAIREQVRRVPGLRCGTINEVRQSLAIIATAANNSGRRAAAGLFPASSHADNIYDTDIARDGKALEHPADLTYDRHPLWDGFP